MTSDVKETQHPDPAGSPLRIPVFRAVWMASILSNFGGLIQSVGAAWMMTSLVSSPQMVALVQASTALPFMSLALLAGAVADNIDRRKVMLAAQFFMLAVSAALALFAWQGWLSPWLLLGFTFLIGCGTAMSGPAWQASVGDIVPRAQIGKAVALNSMGFNIARSVGPAIGGAIVAAAGAAAAFLVNTLSYLGLIIVLLRWRRPAEQRRLPREGLIVAMGAGLRYVAMSPHLRMVIGRAMCFGLAANTAPALMPLIARDLIQGGPMTFGILLGAFGVGAVFGGLSSGHVRGRLSTEATIRLASISLAVGTAVAGLSSHIAITVIALMAAGGSWVLALSTFNITIQLASPRWVVARALSVYQMTAFGGMAIGAWALGLVADHHGVVIALLGGAIAQGAVMLLGFVLPLPQAEDLNLDPISQWTEPETAVPLEPRSGPVVVTIEYRIESHNIAAFLATMTERRRIRRRDGAHGWTLLRDLQDPELWIERYHVATWLDYIRHNQRRTHADAENIATLRTLQKEGEPLRVHRMIERQTGSLPDARRHEPITASDIVSDPVRSA
ncbi:ABC transporter permease [Sphingomonas sp. Root710]|uniref:MFS transporter n=1 Tax=Sphingomonas sp. Root710 TaxID=1736594 RepID=UPI0006F71C7A|nr:ABC transporter permease [Sphingomonas sp. Root710]